MDSFPRRSFLLFATLFEASMIDRQLENKPIHFEISIGGCVFILCSLSDRLSYLHSVNFRTAVRLEICNVFNVDCAASIQNTTVTVYSE